MAGPGGYRPGSGAKKGQHRVHVAELKAAMEKHLGMPYQDMLALTQKKLFNDFQNDVNVKEYVTFTENMSKRLLEQPVQEVSVTNPIEELSNDELRDRINNLLTRTTLSEAATDAEPEDGEEDKAN